MFTWHLGGGSGLTPAFLSTDPSPSRPGSSAEPSRPRANDAPYNPLNIAYYQSYFDVDTSVVLKLVALSMIPREGFIADACEGQIDLYGGCFPTVPIYLSPTVQAVPANKHRRERERDRAIRSGRLTTGPFWTLTTLILALYTTSTLTASITQYLSDPTAQPTSNLPLLSTATSVIYLYGLGVPALLWAATTWLGVGEWRVVEALGIYGYAMSVFIPVSLLCLIPVGILRWVLVGGAALSSGYFM